MVIVEPVSENQENPESFESSGGEAENPARVRGRDVFSSERERGRREGMFRGKPSLSDPSKSYAWANKVYEILDARAEKLAEAVRQREEAEYRATHFGEPISSELPTAEHLASERLRLVQVFVDVEHAIEACGMAAAVQKKLTLTDDEAEEQALRAVLLFLKKHRHLAQFMASHVGNDPTLRELWLKLFVRVTNAHVAVPKNLNAGLAKGPTPLDQKPLWKKWLSIGGYTAGIGAAIFTGASILWLEWGTPPSPSTVKVPVVKPQSEKTAPTKVPATDPEGER